METAGTHDWSNMFPDDLAIEVFADELVFTLMATFIQRQGPSQVEDCNA